MANTCLAYAGIAERQSTSIILFIKHQFACFCLCLQSGELFLFNLLNTFFWRRQIFRHRTTYFLDSATNLFSNFIVGRRRFFCSFYFIFAQFFLCLRYSKQICDKFRTSHVIKNFLTNRQILFLMNVINIHASIQSHIPGILEYCKFFIRNNSCIMGCLCKKLIPLLNITTHDQTPSVFIQLIKMICNFLAICLNSKICLTKSNNRLTRITILYNQVAGISSKLIILNRLIGRSRTNDFPDLRKIALDNMHA